MKQFFKIETAYSFEWNDLRSLITVINVILIVAVGFSISWLGLAVATFGLVKDFTTDHRINSIVMHFANVILNSYFLLIFYQII